MCRPHFSFSGRATAQSRGRATAHGVCLLHQVLDRLLVAGAFGEDCAPVVLGLVDVAPLVGQRGQVAAGEVPVDAHVQAGKLSRDAAAQDPPPASSASADSPRWRWITALRNRSSASSASRASPSATGPQGGGGVAQHLGGPGDQGEQLPRDRVARRRPRQAALEVIQRPVPIFAARSRSCPG